MLEKVHPYYYLGGIIGLVVGFVVSKIYQIWAILYQQSNYGTHKLTSWDSDAPPLWLTATEHSAMFTFWIVLIYIIIGVIFVKIKFSATKNRND
ncbi:MAG TPA: hypothetical protein IAA29_07990 [Candidatus Paenibacillus intestinavium]|nr:hypothetical protein [Candidatus Paenibacillus intestinavium]